MNYKTIKHWILVAVCLYVLANFLILILTGLTGTWWAATSYDSPQFEYCKKVGLDSQLCKDVVVAQASKHLDKVRFKLHIAAYLLAFAAYFLYLKKHMKLLMYGTGVLVMIMILLAMYVNSIQPIFG